MNIDRSGQNYVPKNETPSKVLLVCVYDTVVFQITNQIILAKFQRFGLVKKLLIFEKGQVTKFFIEFEEIQTAIKVKNTLDGTKLYDSICKMSIYYSNFGNVDLRHQTSEGFSYHNEDEQKNITITPETQTKISKDFSSSLENDPLFLAFGVALEPFGRSKTDNPKNLKATIKNMEMQPQQINPQIKRSIDSLFGMDEQIPQEKSSFKMKEQTQIRSPVIVFSIKYTIPCECVYNLFSNFGNISCIVAKKDKIFIKFRTKEFAAIAMTYLSNTIFFGNALHLSEQPELGLSWKPNQGEYCECIYYDFSSDRFTPQRSITINPPSNTLHISSIKREICTERQLNQIFSRYGSVLKIQILQQSKEKNMALVKFVSCQDSFNAISNVHNRTFLGRKIQISFTKSKI